MRYENTQLFNLVLAFFVLWNLILGAPRLVEYIRKCTEKKQQRDRETFGTFDLAGEARPIRSLRSDEKEWIVDQMGPLKRVLQNISVRALQIFLLSVATLGTIIFFFAWLAQEKIDNYDIFAFGSLLIFVVAVTVWNVIRKESQFYKDLRLPVFQVKGSAIIEPPGVDWKHQKIVVRGIAFSSTHNSNWSNILSDFLEGDNVTIEFSPTTKKIWHVYKLTTKPRV